MGCVCDPGYSGPDCADRVCKWGADPLYYDDGQNTDVDPIVDADMYVHSKYTIAFPQNPGKLQQISINKFRDGSRPTLFSDEAASTLSWHIYPNGFTGENVDF